MKFHRLLVLLLIIHSLVILQSCGSENDDSNDSAQTEQGASTGSSTGTTTGDGGGGTSCMTSTQRNNIRTLMDRFAGRSPVKGHATDVSLNNDGTVTTYTYPDSEITVVKTAVDTWKMSGSFCDGDMCIARDIIHSVAGTCYTQDTRVTRITYSSSTKLNTKITDTVGDPIIERSVISVPTTGRVSFNVNIDRNGLRTNALSFYEDIP